MMRHRSLEYGGSGPEGMRGEGINKKNGWESLSHEEFNPQKAADEIKRRLAEIGLQDEKSAEKHQSSKHRSLEYGKSGPEGIRGEGVNESKGWTSSPDENKLQQLRKMHEETHGPDISDELAKTLAEADKVKEELEKMLKDAGVKGVFDNN